jgi:hypothetical protein
MASGRRRAELTPRTATPGSTKGRYHTLNRPKRAREQVGHLGGARSWNKLVVRMLGEAGQTTYAVTLSFSIG